MKHSSWLRDICKRGIMMGVMLIMSVCILGNMKVYAASEESKQAIRKELYEMLMSADSSKHDVSAYNITLKEVSEVWNDMVANEGYLAAHMYGGLCPLPVSYKSGKILKEMYVFGLNGDAAGFNSRYQNAMQHITNVQNATVGMSEIEKVLYAHDYLASICYYKDESGSLVSSAAGPLSNGYGICGGYSNAMMVMLKHLGIDCLEEISSSMYHIWNYVKIDGEWYQLDVTWDDTYKKSQGVDIGHYFMVRNDAEFRSGLAKSHYGWKLYNSNRTEPASTSTIYSNWFVHDIVGRMYYENGLWYYVDNKTGNIVRSKVDVAQSEYEVLVDCKESNASKLKVTGISNGILKYTADGVNKQMDVNAARMNASAALQPTGLIWNEAGYWRSGQYTMSNGTYQNYAGRICLTDYVSIEPNQNYEVMLSQSSWRMLVREMTSNKQFIMSHDLKAGDKLTTNAQTAYLAVSIYTPNNAAMTYQDYVKSFTSGINIGMSKYQLNVSNRVEWNEIGYWRTGQYTWDTGVYAAYNGRICLNDYVEITEDSKYEISVNDSDYHVLVREMGVDRNFITSHEVAGNKTIDVNSNTRYLAISLYSTKNGTMSYSEYAKAFDKGLQVTAKPVEVKTQVQADDVTQTADVNETLNWNQDIYWRQGQYSMDTGVYMKYDTRVCLTDYVRISKDSSYQIVLPDSGCRMLIREMTEDKKMIASCEFAQGDIYTPSDNTSYLAISLYMRSNASPAYDDYLSVISQGVGLQVVEAEATTQEVATQEVITQEVITQEVTTEEAATEETETEEAATEESETEESETEEVATEETETDTVETEESETEEAIAQEVTTEETETEEVTTEEAATE